jgi:predicted esterase
MKRFFIYSTLIFIFLIVYQLFALYPVYFLGLEETYEDTNKNAKIEYVTNDNIKVIKIFKKQNINCPTIVFYHGNYELIDDYVGYFDRFTDSICSNVILVEYNSYGSSTGIPSASKTTEITKNILDEQKISKNQSLIIWGRSIGSAHAFNFAYKYPDIIDKLIITSGFQHPLNAITENKNVINILDHVMVYDYDANKKIDYISNKNPKIEALFIHGEKDAMFSYKLAEEMSQKFNKNGLKSNYIIHKGDHNSFYEDIEEMKNFIK